MEAWRLCDPEGRDFVPWRREAEPLRRGLRLEVAPARGRASRGHADEGWLLAGDGWRGIWTWWEEWPARLYRVRGEPDGRSSWPGCWRFRELVVLEECEPSLALGPNGQLMIQAVEATARLSDAQIAELARLRRELERSRELKRRTDDAYRKAVAMLSADLSGPFGAIRMAWCEALLPWGSGGTDPDRCSAWSWAWDVAAALTLADRLPDELLEPLYRPFQSVAGWPRLLPD